MNHGVVEPTCDLKSLDIGPHRLNMISICKGHYAVEVGPTSPRSFVSVGSGIGVPTSPANPSPSTSVALILCPSVCHQDNRC
jgi:hypothetical protein